MPPASELPIEHSLTAGPGFTLPCDSGEIIYGMMCRVPILICRECQQAPETVRSQIGRNPKLGTCTGHGPSRKSMAVGSTHNCSISVLSGEWDRGNLTGSAVVEEDQVWGCVVAWLHV